MPAGDAAAPARAGPRKRTDASRTAGSRSRSTAAGGVVATAALVALAALTGVAVAQTWDGQAIAPTSIVVMRLGTGSAALPSNQLVPVFLDEYDVGGAVNGTPAAPYFLRSVGLQSTARGDATALTVPAPSVTDTHGGLELSADGFWILVAGYNGSAGVASGGQPPTSIRRVIMRVASNRAPEVATAWTASSTYQVNVAASLDMSRFYVAAQSAGIFTISGTSETRVFQSVYRSVSIRDRLYGSRGAGSGYHYFSVNFPTGAMQNWQQQTMGGATYQEGRGIAWVSGSEYFTVDQGQGTYRVTLSGTTWTKTLLSGVSSNAVLDVTLGPPNNTIVYVTTSSGIFAYSRTTSSWLNGGNAVVAAPADTQFRGIISAPNPMPSPTPSPTPSQTATSTRSPSQTPSASVTPSPSRTGTPSQTPSNTPSPSETPSNAPDLLALANAAIEENQRSTNAAIGGAVAGAALIVLVLLYARFLQTRRTAARIRKLRASAEAARGAGTYIKGLDLHEHDDPSDPERGGGAPPMTVVYQVQVGPPGRGGRNPLAGHPSRAQMNLSTNAPSQLGAYSATGRGYTGARGSSSLTAKTGSSSSGKR